MTAMEMWSAYCKQANIPEDTPHSEWAFCGGGSVGDELAGLVLAGKKTATASLWGSYLVEHEPLPKVGDLSVVLWDNGSPACIIRNDAVDFSYFDEVTDYHAYLEGEGDRTLAYWRQVHEAVFREECEENGMKFAYTIPVVLERFSVVYPENAVDPNDVLLVPPSAAYREELQAYKDEFLSCGDSMDGTGSLRNMDIDHFLSNAAMYMRPDVVLPEMRVPATLLLCVRKSDNRIVGMCQIRHRLNDYLRRVGGHIGYSVRPSERRKGYAKKQLALALNYCKALKIDRAMITCFEQNEGSRRTILSQGGVYDSTIFLEEENKNLERYYIS